MDAIVYEEMVPGEEQAVCDLVERVFTELVAPGYEQEGIDAFLGFANPAALAERVRSGSFVLVAKQPGKLVGTLEFVLPNRIAMLFVTLREQGIAKALVTHAIEKARSKDSTISKVTVHSSPYAEAAYQKMGFRRIGTARIEDGIRYVPMELVLDDQERS